MNRRIVSLVPSLTHTLCEFGLLDEIVGCTSFCVDPPSLRRTCQSIGGTKNPDIDLIKSLRPTHIFSNDEENTPLHIAACEAIAPTFRCLPKSPLDVPKLLEDMWLFLGLKKIGTEMKTRCGSKSLSKAIADLELKSKTSKSFLYLIWRNPWMVAGPDTYISQSLSLLGWNNVIDPNLERYPTITAKAAENLSPDLVIMSSEPYPFRIRDADALKEEWPSCPTIFWADGQLLSWFGSKSLELIQHMNSIEAENIADGKLFHLLRLNADSSPWSSE